jgi:hypothetical protein
MVIEDRHTRQSKSKRRENKRSIHRHPARDKIENKRSTGSNGGQRSPGNTATMEHSTQNAALACKVTGEREAPPLPPHKEGGREEGGREEGGRKRVRTTRVFRTGNKHHHHHHHHHPCFSFSGVQLPDFPTESAETNKD